MVEFVTLPFDILSILSKNQLHSYIKQSRTRQSERLPYFFIEADLVKSKSIEIYSKKIYANKERFKIQGAGVMALTAICPYAQT